VGRRRKSIRLSLWMNGVAVGTWAVDSAGRHHLAYAQDWLESERGRPISLSMPLRPGAPYSGDVVRNFFENLLPDNRVIRERLQARFHTRSTRARESDDGDGGVGDEPPLQVAGDPTLAFRADRRRLRSEV
jgi:serine/threonine-protein kinase HipA